MEIAVPMRISPALSVSSAEQSDDDTRPCPSPPATQAPSFAAELAQYIARGAPADVFDSPFLGPATTTMTAVPLRTGSMTSLANVMQPVVRVPSFIGQQQQQQSQPMQPQFSMPPPPPPSLPVIPDDSAFAVPLPPPPPPPSVPTAPSPAPPDLAVLGVRSDMDTDDGVISGISPPSSQDMISSSQQQQQQQLLQIQQHMQQQAPPPPPPTPPPPRVQLSQPLVSPLVSRVATERRFLCPDGTGRHASAAGGHSAGSGRGRRCVHLLRQWTGLDRRRAMTMAAFCRRRRFCALRSFVPHRCGVLASFMPGRHGLFAGCESGLIA